MNGNAGHNEGNESGDEPASLSLSHSEMDTTQGRREKDGEGEEEDGNENGGGGVTEMFRRQTMDAPFVRSFVIHSLGKRREECCIRKKELLLPPRSGREGGAVAVMVQLMRGT